MSGGKIVTPAQKDHYWALRARGFSQSKAAQEAGFALQTAKGYERDRRKALEHGHVDEKESRAGLFRQGGIAPEWAVPPDKLSDAAQEALADPTGFRFAKRYAGIEISAWQQDMWRTLMEAYESDDREYLCVNAPPGLGKSTLLVVFAARITVENRAVRGLFMSRAYSLAERNTLRLRRLLERTVPFVDGETTLSIDFGRFRARTGELWRRDAFVVEQADGAPIEEKEPTWAAFGFDAEWLGNRLDILIGDDLDSSRTVRNMQTVEGNRVIFDNELEPRVEAKGLMVIAQQRLGLFDFSQHALSKKLLPDDDGETVHPEGEPMYRHITYKAHYPELCKGKATHAHPAPAWPNGCLLDPRRLGWRDMQRAMRNRQTFELVYQQNDLADESGLVQRLWLDGGRDLDGNFYPGCWDDDRGVWELPGTVLGVGNDLAGEKIGYVTVDPSPTNWWSVQAWVHHPGTDQDFLLDVCREKMDAPEFLDWSSSMNQFTGILEDWYANFNKLGVPLSWVIVEANGAQRFMLQYDHFHRWMRTRGAQVIPHSTQRNKQDPEFGIQMLAPLYRAGQIRLPGKNIRGVNVHSVNRLVNELLRWPNSATDDCVLSQWFGRFNLPKLYAPKGEDVRPQWRPTWLMSKS